MNFKEHLKACRIVVWFGIIGSIALEVPCTIALILKYSTIESYDFWTCVVILTLYLIFAIIVIGQLISTIKMLKRKVKE